MPGPRGTGCGRKLGDLGPGTSPEPSEAQRRKLAPTQSPGPPEDLLFRIEHESQSSSAKQIRCHTWTDLHKLLVVLRRIFNPSHTSCTSPFTHTSCLVTPSPPSSGKPSPSLGLSPRAQPAPWFPVHVLRGTLCFPSTPCAARFHPHTWAATLHSAISGHATC